MQKTKEESTAKKIVKGRTSGRFRCLNCFERITPPPGVKIFTCPNCGFAWRIYWFSPGEPRIRGPVWDVNEAQTQKIMAEKGGK